MFEFVKKIARENLTIEEPEVQQQQQQEWRKLVGSIRRRVQRHASTSGTQQQQQQEPTSTKILQQQHSEQQISPTLLPRKNSLTQTSGGGGGSVGRFDFFLKRERSKEENETKDKNEKKENRFMPLIKQKSVEPKPDLAKSLSFKEKTLKSTKNVPSPTSIKHFRKTSEKITGDSGNEKKCFKLSLNKSKNVQQKEEKNRDDFLKATMRIFLVVSPPAGKIQVVTFYYYTPFFSHFCTNVRKNLLA